jgi:hypothetical protein
VAGSILENIGINCFEEVAVFGGRLCGSHTMGNQEGHPKSRRTGIRFFTYGAHGVKI